MNNKAASKIFRYAIAMPTAINKILTNSASKRIGKFILCKRAPSLLLVYV